METKWNKWHAMTSHVIAYRSLGLLFGTHTFNFNCFFEDINCVFTQICCLSRVLVLHLGPNLIIKCLFEHVQKYEQIGQTFHMKEKTTFHSYKLLLKYSAMNPYHYKDSLENIPVEQLCQDFYLKREKNYILSHMGRGMRFPTIWHFDKCRLGRASTAFF